MARKKKKAPFEVFPEKLRDASVSPWDAYRRPDKPVAEFTSDEIGLDGERVSYVYLARKGYELLEQNWRCRYGEADIVASEHEGEAVLVEVKTSLCLGSGERPVPELRVTRAKQERYRRIALAYLIDHDEFSSVRFDVVAVTITGQRTARLRHLVSAFCLDEQ